MIKKPNMKLCFINTKEVFRCMNTKCKRYISARHPIFNYNQFSFLPITKVLEIIWLWSNSHSVSYVQQQTRLNKTTIIKWYSKIRKNLLEAMLSAPAMGGKGFSIQIDESLFRGKRKYNRGRLLLGNKKPIESLSDRLRSFTKTKNTSKRNYGNQITGPWVFGLVLQKLSDIALKKTIVAQKEIII